MTSRQQIDYETAMEVLANIKSQLNGACLLIDDYAIWDELEELKKHVMKVQDTIEKWRC